MKVLVVGAGFVGLTTACVLASRGIDVTIHDANLKKLSSILNGETPFFEPGLENLLKKALESGKLKSNDWSLEPDLTIIAVGTPSRSDGSIDTSHVESAIDECSRRLPAGSLVGIKSTVIPGTTRRIQNQHISANLELLMIPEFLREGSAVNDAMTPDRNVIGARSHEVAIGAANVLGIDPESCIITSTFSAESIKYLSNAFLATCISFTNEIFASINEDDEFEANSVITGWHSDRRFLLNKAGIAGITSYLIPGPGFGGSCFPKDIRALSANLDASKKNSKIVDAVIETNQITLEETSKWLASQLPPTEKYILLGMGFKDDTDDTRESPSLELFKALDLIAPEGFWYDQYVKELPNFGMLKTASQEIIDHAKYFILMHHSDFYRELLRKRATEMNSKDHLTVFALRYQNPILGIKWVYPRSQLNIGEKNG